MEPLRLDTYLLIKSVKKRNPLYDTSAKQYHDRGLKKKLWDEVCSEVYSLKAFNAMTKEEKLYYVREIQKRWASLRHCFRRELNAQKNANATTSKTNKRRKKYEHFDALSFLSPFTESGYTEYSNHGSELGGSECDPFEVLVEIPQRDEDADSTRSSEPDTDTEDPIAKKIKIEDSRETETVNYEERVADRGTSHQDDDEAFFASLIPSMKEFTTDQKLLLRIEILKTIVNFKKRHL